MGVYNIPFVLVSIIGLFAGGSFKNKGKESAATTALVVSLSSSIIGIIAMFMWGLGQL